MTDQRAARAFWIIKHGIRMTGMPAIGKTHDDKKIWAMVAFLKKLHGMSPAAYQKLTKSTGHDDDEPGSR